MAGADDEPAIPIRELPPFPDVEASAQVSEVGVYGASQSEEETVVGAAKREQSLGTVASAVTVLTADQMRRFGYRSLAEALRGISGVYVVDDRMVERIGVRGLQLLGDSNTRILILIDGTPLNEPWAQFVDSSTALPVSLDDVARIEVIRGPVSSIYGTNAFFGIINIVTLEADKAPRAYGRTSIDSYGTYGGNAAFNTGTLNRQVRGSVSFRQRQGETLSYPDLENVSSMPTRADGAMSYFGSIAVNYDRLFFQARGYNRERELPGAPYDSQYGSEDNINQDRHGLAELGYTRELTKRVTLAGRIYGNHYTFENDLLLTNGPFSTKTSATWYGGEVRLLADVLEKEKLLSITTGASYELTSTTSSATTKSAPIETDFDIAGAYLEASTEPRPWFGATAGARFDRNSEFTNELSPRAALFLHKGDTYGLKLLYAAGFRNPSVFEAYYDDDLRFAPLLDADMRTGLRPERIKAYELVAYGRPFTGAKLRVSAWEWRLSDLLRRDEVFDPIDNEIRLRYQNTRDLISRGVEIESTYRDLAGRSVYFNAAFSFTGRNCLEDTGVTNIMLDPKVGNCDEPQNSPVVVAQAGASSQRLFELFHLSAETTFISKRGTQRAEALRVNPDDPDGAVPAYVGLNVVAYAPDIRGIDVTIGARNLIMREEAPAQSDYNRAATAMTPRIEVLRVPGPGREVFMRMGYKF
ncbi:MAG TPA: TonB-dependent receptor plug domain-containing protein [Kofleriaceae bacterium]|nr:TonB-dependent receptor plug domain-containing protein [Kofleriaceae bacterium]